MLNTEKKAGKWLFKSIDVEFNNINKVPEEPWRICYRPRPSYRPAAPASTTIVV